MVIKERNKGDDAERSRRLWSKRTKIEREDSEVILACGSER